MVSCYQRTERAGDEMAEVLQPEQLTSSLARFRAFFSELRGSFVEREEVLTQCALALLCREHVLLTGPPGTAKSQLAASVLGRIIDEETDAPSLFATQFTENTVQTDLIGPINFKTLMASGRTEHFTDEGILGSVHAFLDEVFDGRDMLLRSALGVLKERELKHGAGITRGRVESAFMTSNRYISDVLESARETLLAFVDRIAFIGFVPRGFASPNNLAVVVRRHGGGFGRHTLTAPLTVQDLDQLQLAVDLTYVPEAICDALAHLVRRFDVELADAKRADPVFSPTRYLSTRTVVNGARVLRAAVVYDKAFNQPERSLQVGYDDLSALRYYLTLSGINAAQIAARLEQETDPQERRQLEIMRTESEIFDRCLAAVPRTKVPSAPPALDLASLSEAATTAMASGRPGALAAAAKQLVEATESGATGTDEAARLLVDTVARLASRVLEAGLTSRVGGENELLDRARELLEIASSLEEATGTSRPMAQWLRGRLLALLDDAMRYAPSPAAESVEALLETTPAGLAAQIEARLGSFEAIDGLRRQLQSDGAWLPDPDGARDTWRTAVTRLENELALLLDASFRLSAKDWLGGGGPLGDTLTRLRPIIEELRRVVARVDALGGGGELLQRVVGPRLEPLLARVLDRLDGLDRKASLVEVETVIAELARAGLAHVVTPDRLVQWSVPALLRAERLRRDELTFEVASRGDHERLCAGEDAISLTEALVEIAIRAAPPRDRPAERPHETASDVLAVLRALPEPLAGELIALDLQRVERGIAALEQWWSQLSAGHDGAVADAEQTVTLLENVVASGFLRVMRSDGTPLRLVIEAERLGEVFPACLDRVARLRERIRALDTSSASVLSSLLQGHANRAWTRTLAGE